MDNIETPQPAARGPHRELGSEVNDARVETENATDVEVTPEAEVPEVGGNPVVPEEFDPEGDVKTEAEVVAEEAEANPRENEGADLPVEAESGDPMQGAPNKGVNPTEWEKQADDVRAVDDQGGTDPGGSGAASFGTTGGTAV